jgi:hypothetical protein
MTKGGFAKDSRRRLAARNRDLVRDFFTPCAGGGVYREDHKIALAVPADDPSFPGIRPRTVDPEAPRRLWTMSEKLVGESFAI